MNKVARKYFLPVLFGSVLVFAIDCEHIAAAAITSNCESQYTMSTSLKSLDDDGFWGKFRDSVMKDKDRNGSNDDDGPSEPSRGGEVGGNDHGGGEHGEHDHGGMGGHGDGRGTDHR